MKDTLFTVTRMLRREQVERNLCILKVRGQRFRGHGDEIRGSEDEARQLNRENNRTGGPKDQCTYRPELQQREGNIWIGLEDKKTRETMGPVV